MRRVGFVVALVATACFKPTPPEGAACNASGECPHPLSCFGGICTRAPSDAPEEVRDSALTCANRPTLGAFGAPVANAVLSSPSDEGTPSLTADRLEMYFKSNRPGGEGGFDIWRSTRTSTSEPWGVAATVSEINGGANELGVEISGDGLTIYFSSDRLGTSGSFDFWVASRATRTTTFGSVARIAALSSSALDEGIYVSPDQTIAYFQSDRMDTAANPTLFRATRGSATAAWSPPVLVVELATAAGEENPWVTADDCVIYFQSARAGTAGGLDLWTARRPATGMPFGAPTNLGAVNGSASDADGQLSADERTMTFSSNRPGLGFFDIYEVSR